jgi:tetratricopeptide (TPR) repeat protein
MRLEGKTVKELKQLAQQLNIEGRSKLNTKKKLIGHIIANYSEYEIEAAHDVKVPRRNRFKKRQVFWFLGVIGSIASIIGFIFALQPTPSIQRIDKVVEKKLGTKINPILKKLEQFDPIKRDRLIKQFKIKIKELETALKDEKSGNTKERKEALIALKNGNLKKAQEIFENIRQREREKEIRHAKTAYNLGNVYLLDFKFKNALGNYLDANRLDPDNTDYLLGIGFIYEELAEHLKAIEFYQRVLDISVKTNGDVHPILANVCSNLGCSWLSLGNHKKAIKYLEKALDRDLKTYGESHPVLATSWNNLGGVWNEVGEHKKAIESLKKALCIFENTLGGSHHNTQKTKRNLVRIQKRLLEDNR